MQRGASDMKEIDTLILVVGQAGVGKSTFINIVAGREVTNVSHGLEPCTVEPKYVICPLPRDPTSPSRIVLVDTPGLNNPDIEDYEKTK